MRKRTRELRVLEPYWLATAIFKEKVARVTGLEPAASGVTGRRSNQLSYTRAERLGFNIGQSQSQSFEPPTVFTRAVEAPSFGGRFVVAREAACQSPNCKK